MELMWIALTLGRSIGRAAKEGRHRGKRGWRKGAKRADCRWGNCSGKAGQLEHGCAKGGE